MHYAYSVVARFSGLLVQFIALGPLGRNRGPYIMSLETVTIATVGGSRAFHQDANRTPT